MLSGKIKIHEEKEFHSYNHNPPNIHQFPIPVITPEKRQIFEAAIKFASNSGLHPGKEIITKTSGLIGTISYINQDISTISWFMNKPLLIRVINIGPSKFSNYYTPDDLTLLNPPELDTQ